MLDLLQELSLESGAVLVALASAVLSLAWTQLSNPTWKFRLAVGTPVLLALLLYWLPVLLGDSAGEYIAWMLLFVVPWSLAGMVPSVLIVALFHHLRKVR